MSIGFVLATDDHKLAAMVSAVRALGEGVTIVAIGPRGLAEHAAAAQPDRVAWIEKADDVPAEAYAPAVAGFVAQAHPKVVLAAATPAGRALLGAVAAALDAAVISGVLAISLEGDTLVVDRTDLGGRVLETVTAAGPIAGLFGGSDSTSPAQSCAAPVEQVAADALDAVIVKTEPSIGAGRGVSNAERVVAVGRGLKERADLAIVEDLAQALGAALGCSMPIADDFGWLPKQDYIGRSGQHISPRLYVAIGISGAPQHLDGVRDAKTVVAVNSDPEAPIFQRADYGIVGDLCEVVPALQAALVATGS